MLIEIPPPYSLHPSFEYEASGLANLPKRTGRSLDEWIAVIKADGPATESARRAWLKAEHGFTSNYALWVAARVDGQGWPEDYDPVGMVEAMFAGPKAALKPLYDQLLAIGLSIGSDVRVCPCQTIVPLYRNHVFAQIKPTTETRIDLGLALGKAPDLPARLIDTGGLAKGDRITHRIAVTLIQEIDNELKHWLNTAYRLDA